MTVVHSSLGDSWVIRVVPEVARTSYSSPALQFYHNIDGLEENSGPVNRKDGLGFINSQHYR